MQNLHERIMAAVAKTQEDNNVKQNTGGQHTHPSNLTNVSRSRSFFRMSSTYATSMTPELLAQLDRYCVAEKRTRSRAIRNAVYAVMENQSRLSEPPAGLPTIGEAPARTCVVSWTMPSNKPEHVEHLHNLCPSRGSQSNFVRRAIYQLTKQHRSADAEEHKQAMKDAWF